MDIYSTTRISGKMLQKPGRRTGLNKVEPSIYTQCFTAASIKQKGWCRQCHLVDHATKSCPVKPLAASSKARASQGISASPATPATFLLQGRDLHGIVAQSHVENLICTMVTANSVTTAFTSTDVTSVETFASKLQMQQAKKRRTIAKACMWQFSLDQQFTQFTLVACHGTRVVCHGGVVNCNEKL